MKTLGRSDRSIRQFKEELREAAKVEGFSEIKVTSGIAKWAIMKDKH